MVIDKKGIIELYSCVKLVQGASRSLLIDFQRNKFELIPNTLALLLIKYKKKEIQLVYNDNPKDHISLNEYFHFLYSKDLMLPSDVPYHDSFSDMNETFYPNSTISNSIVEADKLPLEKMCNIFEQLSLLGCRNIQLKFYKYVKLSYLSKILHYFRESKFHCVDLLIKDGKDYNDSNITDLITDNIRIRHLILHSSFISCALPINLKGVNSVVRTMDVIMSHQHCGNISPYYFSINLHSFNEAKSHNSCLNRKLSIDINGDIKNCPSMDITYGNINDTSLQEVLIKNEFRSLWSITKDSIEICKDCEFRYICLDCRAFTQKNSVEDGKPLKCSYNPYNSFWEDSEAQLKYINKNK